MNIIGSQIELSVFREAHESNDTKIESLERKISRRDKKITKKKAEIDQLKACLKNEIASKGNDIKTMKLKVVEISEFLGKWKTLNKKQLTEVKNSVRAIIADADKSMKIFDYSYQDLNFKESEMAQNQSVIITRQNLIDKRSKILKWSNSAELENEFRMTCSLYESQSNTHDLPIAQAFQDYISAYHQKASLFNVFINDDRRANLFIYNTETEYQESKALKTQLDWGTCITQLPNGKIFCFGSYYSPGITLLIDVNNNYRVEKLRSGTACWWSSAIYFNNYIYCFGGHNNNGFLTLSSRFDSSKNKWNELTPLPKADYGYNSVIFNGQILISGEDKNLWRYSIENNYFTIIPYDFAERKTKILINAERLYLIECSRDGGSMYESEIGSDSAWRWIANSTIDYAYQTYCIYNKWGIYIGLIHFSRPYLWHTCFKFDLNDKSLAKVFSNEL